MATPLENGKTHTGTRPCKKAKKRQLHRKLVPINESSKESKRNSKERNAEEQDSAPLACGIRVGDMENVSEALGLRSDFLNGVKSLPQDIFNHRGFRGFVNIHIQNEYFEIEEQSLKVKLSEELLRRIGFTDSSVINTIMTRSKTMGQHLDLIDFIKRFVKDEFKYHPTLMEHASEDKASIPKGTGVFHFADYSNDEQNEYCKVVRLFHGTDLHSALDIMKNGIKLDFGRHKHDFSDGGGFYLTTQFDHAKAWACCQSRKPVVLELKIPKTCLEEARTLNLEVSNKSVLNRLVSLCQVFVCFPESHSHCLMADMTLLNIARWAVLYHLLNVIICDKDFKQNNLPRFPYQEVIMGKSFIQSLSIGGNPRTIKMMNVLIKRDGTEFRKPNVQSVFLPSEEETKGCAMLYHGTSHHGHAKSILEGIKLTESDENGDFSCGKGFYLTKRFERAEEYAFPKPTAKAAVLAFKIPNDKLDRFLRTSINLVGEEKKEEWQDVVRNISSISDRGDISFIEGPEMRRVDGKKTYEQLPNSHQMCIHNEALAESLDRYLYSVVFYNTTED